MNAERPVFYRENAAQMYPSFVYSVAWVLAEVRAYLMRDPVDAIIIFYNLEFFFMLWCSSKINNLNHLLGLGALSWCINLGILWDLLLNVWSHYRQCQQVLSILVHFLRVFSMHHIFWNLAGHDDPQCRGK